MVAIDRLSAVARERLVLLYNSVRDAIMSDSMNCNNWVKKQFFDDAETGFQDFVDNLAASVNDNEISWYMEDDEIAEWCIHTLRVADFLYKP